MPVARPMVTPVEIPLLITNRLNSPFSSSISGLCMRSSEMGSRSGRRRPSGYSKDGGGGDRRADLPNEVNE